MNGQLTNVGSVRAAAQAGDDRFVIDLGSSPLQQYEVRTQPTSKFTLDPKGEVVTLNGTDGVEVILRRRSIGPAGRGRPALEASCSGSRC